MKGYSCFILFLNIYFIFSNIWKAWMRYNFLQNTVIFFDHTGRSQIWFITGNEYAFPSQFFCFLKGQLQNFLSLIHIYLRYGASRHPYPTWRRQFLYDKAMERRQCQRSVQSGVPRPNYRLCHHQIGSLPRGKNPR